MNKKKPITAGILVLLTMLIIPARMQAASTTSKLVFKLDFVEHNDGCLVLSGQNHYIDSVPGYRTNSSFGSSSPIHRNDNKYLLSRIDYFNNEIRRLNAVTEDNQNSAFSKTQPGGWYYVYRVSIDYIQGRYAENKSATRIPLYHYRIWKVNKN